jgi:hypothetical protein
MKTNKIIFLVLSSVILSACTSDYSGQSTNFVESTSSIPEATKTIIPSVKVQSTPSIKPKIKTGDSYVCDCSKTCTQIRSCKEAYYQLEVCRCNKRDGDSDGIPCENLCK